MGAEPARRCRWCPWAIVLVLALGVPAGLWVSLAQAQAVPKGDAVQFTPAACLELGNLVYHAAEARAIDGRMELFLDRLSRRIDALPRVRKWIVEEARRAWLSGLDSSLLRESTIARCNAGPMPLGEDV